MPPTLVPGRQVFVPLLSRLLFGVELTGDHTYEMSVLVLWTVPAYVVCEVVSTSWCAHPSFRMGILWVSYRSPATLVAPPPVSRLHAPSA